MSMTVSTAVRTILATAIRDAIDGGSGAGTIKVYTGSKPAGPDTALSGQTLLGTLTCSDPCGTISSGVLTFSAVTQDSSADATGTAAWVRIADSAGTAVVDLSAGTSGTDVIFNTTSIVSGGPIAITSLTVTM